MRGDGETNRCDFSGPELATLLSYLGPWGPPSQHFLPWWATFSPLLSLPSQRAAFWAKVCVFFSLCVPSTTNRAWPTLWTSEGLGELTGEWLAMEHCPISLDKFKSSGLPIWGKWKPAITVSPPRLPKISTAGTDLWNPVANYITHWKKNRTRPKGKLQGERLRLVSRISILIFEAPCKVVSHPKPAVSNPNRGTQKAGLSEFWVWGAICMAEPLSSSLWLFFFFLINLFILIGG